MPDEASMDTVTTILCDTSWYSGREGGREGRDVRGRIRNMLYFRDGAIEIARQQRNALCTFLNVTPPKSKVGHAHYLRCLHCCYL